MNIFNGIDDNVITGKDIVLDGNMISKLIPTGGDEAAYAEVIDGKGKYLMPGLGEMHAHVPPVDDLEPMKEVLFLFAANGITTIRGMLGHPRHIELRSKINSGENSCHRCC